MRTTFIFTKYLDRNFKNVKPKRIWKTYLGLELNIKYLTHDTQDYDALWLTLISSTSKFLENFEFRNLSLLYFLSTFTNITPQISNVNKVEYINKRNEILFDRLTLSLIVLFHVNRIKHTFLIFALKLSSFVLQKTLGNKYFESIYIKIRSLDKNNCYLNLSLS